MAGNVKNLRPFKPGQSGNPGGRARSRHVTDLLSDALAQPSARSGQRKDKRLVRRLVDIALNGKRSDALRAMQLIFAYIDGLPIARTETGEPGAFASGFEIRLVHVEHGDVGDGA
jgi:hypothetical protein